MNLRIMPIKYSTFSVRDESGHIEVTEAPCGEAAAELYIETGDWPAIEEPVLHEIHCCEHVDREAPDDGWFSCPVVRRPDGTFDALTTREALETRHLNGPDLTDFLRSL